MIFFADTQVRTKHGYNANNKNFENEKKCNSEMNGNRTKPGCYPNLELFRVGI